MHTKKNIYSRMVTTVCNCAVLLLQPCFKVNTVSLLSFCCSIAFWICEWIRISSLYFFMVEKVQPKCLKSLKLTDEMAAPIRLINKFMQSDKLIGYPNTNNNMYRKKFFLIRTITKKHRLIHFPSSFKSNKIMQIHCNQESRKKTNHRPYH